MNVRFSAASSTLIEDEVARVVSVMPVPRNTDAEGLIRGYVSALGDMPIEAIRRAVDAFLDGRFSPEFSARWCPMPPELATMVRRSLTDASKEDAGAEYWYRLPRSRLLRQRITRDTVRQYVDNGLVPRGVIWIPGAHARPGDRPDIGTLYAPDPQWNPAQLLDKRSQSERDAEDAVEERNMPPLSAEGQHKLDAFRKAMTTTARAA